MKVTPALKKELAQWLDTYWITYLKGDIETWATFIRDDYRNIGGTKEEIWNSKQEIIDYTTKILDQMIGTAEIRNREIEVIPYGEYMMVNEFTDLYVKIEGEWTFYGPFRMSSLLEKTDTGWIALHQHGSYPDMKALEGEAFSIDAIKAENAKLQEAVKSRTLELEIEAAFERVRAVAMGMKKPEEMLDVCRIISDQLQQFGVTKIRNVQTAIIDENIGQYLCYQYFTPYHTTAVEKTEYLKSPVEHGMVKQMLASRDGHFIGKITGKELKEFRAHRKEEKHFPDPHLDDAKELAYCFLSIGEGGLGLTLYHPMEADVLTLFKRFHQVFSLAYQRFRDIQKAEAQAREAQIEVAVEKVRAQSMAMHHPDDLDKVNKEILTQLNWLQIQGLSGVTFYLVDQDGWVKAWDFSSPGNIGDPTSYTLQFDFKRHEMLGFPFKTLFETDQDYFVADYPLEKLEKGVSEFEEIDPTIAKILKEALSTGALTHQWTACARITDGVLGIDLVSPPSEDTKTIVLKIAGAFNQAYQRFLDLQKAEVQAREAQIEAALERVRSRTMAMQSSAELGAVAAELFAQMNQLVTNLWTCGFVLCEKNRDEDEWWLSMDGDFTRGFFLPNVGDYAHATLYEGWVKGEAVRAVQLDGDVLQQHYRWLMDIPVSRAIFEEMDAAGLARPDWQKLHAAYFSKGYLVLITREPCGEEEIFRRFAQVFDQTYTRFLDLQKAEAQAREAQIQLALERVRARSLAMHHTSELQEIVKVVAQQLQHMGLNINGGVFITINEELDQDIQLWASLGAADYVQKVLVPLFDRPIFTQLREAIKKGNNFFDETYSKAEKDEMFQHLFHFSPWKELPSERKEELLSREGGLTRTAAISQKTSIVITNHNGNRFSDQEKDILKRFGSVFEQTYTRFLDLQKAEAQAKEAKIELGLERVRARAMAMQHSDELAELVTIVFKELTQLDFTITSSIIWINNPELLTNTLWVTSAEMNLPAQPIQLSTFHHDFFHSIIHAWKEKDSKWIYPLTGNEKSSFEKSFFKSAPGLPKALKSALTVPEKVVFSATFNNFGALELIGTEPLTDEKFDILHRFGKVFDSSYTRFNDLKKAEAQAREAKIEAALERVRSRSMAMRKPDELTEIIGTIFTELSRLDVALLRCVIEIWNSETYDQRWWMANAEDAKRPVSFFIKYIDLPPNKAFLNAWKKKLNKWVYLMKGDIKREWDRQMLSETELSFLPETVKTGMRNPAPTYCNTSFNSYGCLTFVSPEPLPDDQFDILIRFANVFDQTYSRFNDLQKAEAQAREAQIQLALERVRARTMAMQKSDELQDASMIMFQQIQTLGPPSWGCGYNIWDEDKKAATSWNSGKDGLQTHFKYPTDKDVFLQFYKAAQRGESLYVEQMGGEALVAHYEYLATLPELAETFKDGSASGVKLPAFQIFHTAYFSQGYLLFITYEPVPEMWDIFKRFAKVFEQTYTRFLDLQKAEAQARESQIQLALERVRARTMAMQRSEELPETSFVLYEQLKQLGEPAEQLTIGVVHEENNVIEISATLHGGVLNKIYWHSIDEPFMMNKVYRAWKTQQKTLIVELKGDQLNAYNKYRNQLTKSEMFPTDFDDEQRRIVNAAFFSKGMLAFAANEPRPPQSLELLERFASVFDLTYTRFLDLQKAEAQAREAQIEAALERVRSRSMGMQKSEELKDVIKVVYDQLVHLNIKLDHAGFVVDYQPKADWHFWIADKQDIPSKITHPYFESVWANQFNEAKEKATDFFATHLNFEEKNKFYQKLLSYVPGLPETSRDFYLNCPGLAATTVLLEDVALYVENFTAIPYTDEENKTVLRFGKVFQQTYTRFLDLQKAEAQARESQIQLALERVRARTMAMQHSNELTETAIILFQQMKSLGVQTGSCGFNIWNKDEKTATVWMSSAEGGLQTPFTLPHTESAIYKQVYEAMKNGETFLVKVVDGKNLIAHFEYLITLPDIGDIIKKLRETGYLFPETMVYHFAFFSHGYLSFHLHELHPETHDIFKRFAKVFEQTYTRFLDLQKAEAQAREAQIEVALERVRSRSMGMQKSEELKEVIQVIYEQFIQLGLKIDGAGFALDYMESDDFNFWVATSNSAFPNKVHTPYFDHPQFNRYKEAKEKGLDFYTSSLTFEEKNKFFDHVLKGLPSFPQELKEVFYVAPGYMTSHVVLTNVMLYILNLTGIPFTEAENVTLMRFGKAFEQTYIRFNDLKQAEAQAREAQIETSLERVRSKTMAMHNSEDVGETVATLFDELVKLGVHTNRCGIIIHKEDKMQVEVWTAKSNPSGKANLIIGQLYLTIHPMLEGIYHSWKNKEPVFKYTMMGDDLKSYYQAINNTKYYPIQFDLDALPSKEFHTDFNFAEGSIFVFTSESIADEAASIFKRFAKVFGQTYRRYLDLQRAEAQTHKANIETALERVRARALAMQQPEELTEVAQVMRHEMGLLGVEELETSSIYIHEEASENAECWYAIKDSKVPEKKLVSDHFKLHLNDTWVGQQMHAFYHSNKKQISIPMKGANRKEWIDYCSSQSKLLDGFYGDVIPDRTYHLYKFSNGTIGAATPGNISAESWDLLQRAASVFSLAYSRFKDLTQARIDLQKLKEEKQRAEDALTELQATQKQLIQSEKMASLGELTAGIAHEIQNPLNFVNNFSEVSAELIKEMVEEVDKGNTEEIKAIANDVVQNLEKINHHGKRASSIVKGMLEHSRTSSGKKEPTDINALADEYLKLAYQSLRAKDKDFNAILETDFDTTLPKINVVSQDIGRVILNLITNAFYAVNERNKKAESDYVPTVSINTLRVDSPLGVGLPASKQAGGERGKGDYIQISVSDNGSGIPDTIKEKIFQPFFTTKPTGQGTGLGLSLAYDIVKAHGGELNVETKEGEGTTFIFQLLN